MPTLAEVQRHLWRLISAPEGVAAALAADPDAGGQPLATWLADAPPLAAARRLEVYANAYFQRIHDCLVDDFGALAAAVGEAGFHDLVTAYLIAHPSRHPSLRHVGAELPGYLSRAAPAAPFRRRWPWAGDLAELEWALGCAFDAADAAPLTREQLARSAPQDWDALVLRFAPALRVVETGWPVHAIYSAWRRDAAIEAPTAPAPECVAVWRRDESVRHRALDPLEGELLRAAGAGMKFGELCALAAHARGAAAAPELTASHLGRWVDDGLVVAALAAAAPD